MTGKTRPPSEILSLEAFLERIDDEVAVSEARVAAAKMDALERSIDDVRDLEQQYAWLAIAAAVAFVAGAVIVLFPGETMATVYQIVGPFGVVMLLGGVPLLGLIYGLKVRHRSYVDLNKIALNRKHFVPYGGYYFPAERPEDPARVIVTTFREDKRPFSRHDHVRPGASWW